MQKNAMQWLSVSASLALIFTTTATSVAAVFNRRFVPFDAHGGISVDSLDGQMLSVLQE